MNAKKIHSREAKASCDASTAAQLSSPAGKPLPDSAYLDAPDREELVLKLPASVGDAQMDQITVFCDAMLTKHGISIDEALYELFRQQWDVRAAEQHFSAAVKESREWSEADLKLFCVGFTAFGKNFDKIRLLLPHKPLTELVKHYYDTKTLQFYRTLSPQEGDEEDDAASDENGDDSSIERKDDRENVCIGYLKPADYQVVPAVSNLSDDVEDMQVDDGHQHVAGPVKRSPVADTRTGAKKPKKTMGYSNREAHASMETPAAEPVAKVHRFMRNDQEKVMEVIHKERAENASDNDESFGLIGDIEIICLDDA